MSILQIPLNNTEGKFFVLERVMKTNKTVVTVKSRAGRIEVKAGDLGPGFFVKKLELRMKEIKNFVIKARMYIAGFSMAYNTGGRKYIREAVNDYLRYFASSYEDSVKLGYNLIEDILKSPELVHALRVFKKLQRELANVIDNDKLLLGNCKAAEEIMRDDPRQIKTVVINGYTIPANARHSWKLRKDDGTLISKKEIEESFETFLVYSEKAYQKKIAAFERDEEIRRFETELEKADGNITAAYLRLFPQD